MKRYYIISGLFWGFFLLCVLTLGSSETTVWNKQNFPYLLENDYSSFSELVSKFFTMNLSSDLFNYCCDVINYFGNSLGFSYTQMNLIIFVFGFPLFMLNMVIISILQMFEIVKLKKLIKN